MHETTQTLRTFFFSRLFSRIMQLNNINNVLCLCKVATNHLLLIVIFKFTIDMFIHRKFLHQHDYSWSHRKCMLFSLHWNHSMLLSTCVTIYTFYFSLTWTKLNPSMDKLSHVHESVRWNYFSNPKIQWCLCPYFCCWMLCFSPTNKSGHSLLINTSWYDGLLISVMKCFNRPKLMK